MPLCTARKTGEVGGGGATPPHGAALMPTETPLWIAGAMSGTSLDGVDVALLRTDGARLFEIGPSLYRPYAPAERAALKRALGAVAARSTAELRADPAPAPEATRVVTEAHRAALADLIAQASGAGAPGPDLLALHGQTLLHRPDEGFTLQVLDAQALADAFSLPVAHAFRVDDVAAGGQGAPLASLHHFALVASAEAGRDPGAPVAVLNLGGVGNVTFVDPTAPGPEAPGALLAFDTGPANALMDDWMAARAGRAYDVDGAAAAAGRADTAAVERWLAHPYYAAQPPKSLDRDAFAPVSADLAGVSIEDGAATLALYTARSVARAATWAPRSPARWLVTGGGRRNPTLMGLLRAALAAPVEPIEALTVGGRAVDGDMLEARAFAQLGARMLAGDPITVPGTTGAPRPLTGGRVTRPV